LSAATRGPCLPVVVAVVVPDPQTNVSGTQEAAGGSNDADWRSNGSVGVRMSSIRPARAS